MSAPNSQSREIDWASAAVESSTLTLELTGKSSKAWNEHFDSVLALLSTNHADWGEIGLRKSKIHVSQVQPDAAPDLRHLLESIVRQVNSDLSPHDGDAPSKSDPRKQADEQLAAAFRAFAEPQDT